jgi:phosphate-selective porin OprO/OprP
MRSNGQCRAWLTLRIWQNLPNRWISGSEVADEFKTCGLNNQLVSLRKDDFLDNEWCCMRPFSFLYLVIAVLVTALHSFLLSSPAHSQAGFPDGPPIGSYFAQVDASETQEFVQSENAEHLSNNELQSPGENAEIGDERGNGDEYEADRKTEPSDEAEICLLPGEPRKLEAEFGEGFALVSEDEEFELRIHILNQVDYKLFSPSDQEPAAIDGVYIPRMRVYFEGKLTDPFRYEISLQRSVEGEFDLLDANLDIRFSEGFQVRFGRTLIPYSYGWYDHLEQYSITPERALFPLNFGLSRAAGVQVWGQDTARRWEYSFGGYDGRVAGLADNSTTTDFVSYLNFRPFVQQRAGGLLENLNFGASLVLGKYRRPTELVPFRSSVQSSENDESADAASAVFLEVEPGVVGFGDRVLGAIHAAWYAGPVSLETEWNSLQVELLNEATDEVVDTQANGFHVTLASFLTGETVRGREVVQPLCPFDPRCGLRGRGAVEPFIRYSYLKIGNEVFDRGFVDATDWTDEVSMTDLGVNWYLNRYAKFVFDWQHSAYGSPVLVNESTGQVSDRNDLYWFRCQLYF